MSETFLSSFLVLGRIRALPVMDFFRRTSAANGSILNLINYRDALLVTNSTVNAIRNIRLLYLIHGFGVEP